MYIFIVTYKRLIKTQPKDWHSPGDSRPTLLPTYTQHRLIIMLKVKCRRLNSDPLSNGPALCVSRTQRFYMYTFKDTAVLKSAL